MEKLTENLVKIIEDNVQIASDSGDSWLIGEDHTAIIISELFEKKQIELLEWIFKNNFRACMSEKPLFGIGRLNDNYTPQELLKKFTTENILKT